MSQRPRPDPKYRLHKQSGQAIVTLPDHVGRRRDVLLGEYGSEESKQRYDRELAEWRANGGGRRLRARSGVPTIADIVLRFKNHAEQHYRHPDDDRVTSEVGVYRRAVRELLDLYSDEPADEFGPLKLKAVRQKMIDNNLSRRVINRFVMRIRGLFKWAASEEFLPAIVYQNLRTVMGLQRGRTSARECDPIRPIQDAHVEAISKYLNPSIRAMIELQQLTGMRPGEVCSMRATDIDRNGKTWLYYPARHKNAWRGADHKRIIPLGPRAQEIVKSFFTADVNAPLFSPKRERERRAHELREQRKRRHYERHPNREFRIQPSQQDRRQPNAKMQPRDQYDKDSYARAIRAGIDRANKEATAKALKNGQSEASVNEIVPHWHPNQLRHSFATRIRREYGLEKAQVLLGHKRCDITQTYAESNNAEAVNFAQMYG